MGSASPSGALACAVSLESLAAGTRELSFSLGLPAARLAWRDLVLGACHQLLYHTEEETGSERGCGARVGTEPGPRLLVQCFVPCTGGRLHAWRSYPSSTSAPLSLSWPLLPQARLTCVDEAVGQELDLGRAGAPWLVSPLACVAAFWSLLFEGGKETPRLGFTLQHDLAFSSSADKRPFEKNHWWGPRCSECRRGIPEPGW